VPQAEQNAARSAKTAPQLKQFGIDSARFGAAYTVQRKGSTSELPYAVIRITEGSAELRIEGSCAQTPLISGSRPDTCANQLYVTRSFD
jgi:hypothetical protein